MIGRFYYIHIEKNLHIRNKGFENLIAWQKARMVNKIIYELSSKGGFARDFGFQNQVRRSSVSISSNIAEGWGRRSEKEFLRFLDIAKGSCNELKSQLYLAMDVDFLNEDEFNNVFELTDEVSKSIFGLMKHLNKTK